MTAFALHRPTCEQQQRLQLSCKTLTDQCDTAAAAYSAAAAHNDGATAAFGSCTFLFFLSIHTT